MGRRKTKNLDETVGRVVEAVTPPDPGLRRSTRKRKPNKHADFDYDSEGIDCQTPKIIRQISKTYQGFSRSIISLPPPPMSDSSYEVVPESPEEQEAESPSSSSSSNRKIVRKYERKTKNKSNSDTTNNSVPISDKLTPTLLFQRMEIASMNPMQIINSHAENLEQRLKNVAYKYLRSWTPPPPTYVPPYSLVVGNPKRYSITEPDDIAVLRVVRDMLDAVAASQK